MLKGYIAYLKDNPENYWFKARLFGWGWIPATREGWISILLFIVLLLGNTYRHSLRGSLNEEEVPVQFLLETLGLILILLFVTWKKGEKPQWNWGIPDKYKESQYDKS